VPYLDANYGVSDVQNHKKEHHFYKFKSHLNLKSNIKKNSHMQNANESCCISLFSKRKFKLQHAIIIIII
jgi:hypothetical protein